MKFIILGLFTFFLISCEQDNRNLMTKAISYGNQNQYQKGIALTDRIIFNLNKQIESGENGRRMWSLYTDAYILRGIYKARLGDTTGAIDDFNYVVNIRESQGYAPGALVHFSMAQVYSRLEKYELAYSNIMQSYDRLSTVFNQVAYVPHEWELIHNIPLYYIKLERAIIYFELDSLDNALDDINFCLNFENVQDTAYYWRGKIQVKRGDTISACKDLRRAVDLGISSANSEIEKYCNQ
jgi:hypothetical protein